MVEDIASGTAFPGVVTRDAGQVQGVIKRSECQQSGVGGDGNTVEFPADLEVELESEKDLSPSPMGCLQDAYVILLKSDMLWSNYSHTDGQRLKNI